MFFFEVLIIVLIFAIYEIIISFYLKYKKHGIVYDKEREKKYAYFVQAEVDKQNKLVGYECLLRAYDSEEEQWTLPEHLGTFSLQETITLLNEMFKKDESFSGFVALNVTLEQLTDLRFTYFVNWAQSKVSPAKLQIEISITNNLGFIQARLLKNKLSFLKNRDVLVIIDRIETTDDYFSRVKPFLKYVGGIKIPMSRYREYGEKHWLDLNIGKWVRIAQRNNLKIFIT
ncbi:MAG: hypothetical protein ABF470_08345 [Liquorilactobacillus sp.]